MPTATPEQLTATYRQTQTADAARVALAVAAYYKARVNVRDPAAVEAWLVLALPKILAAFDSSASAASIYGNLVRALELPRVKDTFAFDKATAVFNDKQVRTSLSVVGPTNLIKQLDRIKQLDKDPVVRRALQSEAIDNSVKAVGNTTLKHVLNGGRTVIDTGVKADPVALGYIRVTKADPCFFCAMLASRGITYGPYRGGSFDSSDARFIGEGSVKVHDHCSCALKPCYSEADPMLAQSEEWRDLWDSMEHRGGSADILQFRQLYEGREVTAA